MHYGAIDEETTGICRWKSRNVDWEEYVSDLMESASESGLVMANEVNAESLLDCVMAWVLKANDRWMKRCKRGIARKLA